MAKNDSTEDAPKTALNEESSYPGEAPAEPTKPEPVVTEQGWVASHSYCSNCNTLQFPASDKCANCGSEDVAPVKVINGPEGRSLADENDNAVAMKAPEGSSE